MKLKYGGVYFKWEDFDKLPIVEASPESVYELQKSVWYMSINGYPSVMEDLKRSRYWPQMNVEWKYHDGEMGAIYVPCVREESTYEFIMRIVQKKEGAK